MARRADGRLALDNVSVLLVDAGGEGVDDARDNCPATANSDPTDTDSDAADDDSDGVLDTADNRDFTPNARPRVGRFTSG
jgi:hypothetical protein